MAIIYVRSMLMLIKAQDIAEDGFVILKDVTRNMVGMKLAYLED